MKTLKVGKYTLIRHWWRWYWVHQLFGGSVEEENYLERIKFPVKFRKKKNR